MTEEFMPLGNLLEKSKNMKEQAKKNYNDTVSATEKSVKSDEQKTHKKQLNENNPSVNQTQNQKVDQLQKEVDDASEKFINAAKNRTQQIFANQENLPSIQAKLANLGTYQDAFKKQVINDKDDDYDKSTSYAFKKQTENEESCCGCFSFFTRKIKEKFGSHTEQSPENEPLLKQEKGRGYTPI